MFALHCKIIFRLLDVKLSVSSIYTAPVDDTSVSERAITTYLTSAVYMGNTHTVLYTSLLDYDTAESKILVAHFYIGGSAKNVTRYNVQIPESWQYFVSMIT
jgi:hypothetical protein